MRLEIVLPSSQPSPHSVPRIELVQDRDQHQASQLHFKYITFTRQNTTRQVNSCESCASLTSAGRSVNMEPNTPQQDTTVGRVQIPETVFNHGSLLAGTLSGSHIAQANSARRRLYGPTLLGSPARRGHSPGMKDIFGDAKNNLARKNVSAMGTASPMPTLRQLPLRPKLTTGVSNLEVQPYKPATPESAEGAALYPKVPDASVPLYPQTSLEGVLDVKPNTSPAKPLVLGSENWQHHFEVGHHSFARASASFQQQRLSPAPLSRQNSYFSRPPQITHAHAQLVPMSSIETPRGTQEDLGSSSSASWTGDSQFYMPQKRVLSLPPQQTQDRKSSVPEWLERLPAELGEFEKAENGGGDEDGEEEVVPLSPEVEIERGSMRWKVRGSPEKKRRLSFLGEDEMDLS